MGKRNEIDFIGIGSAKSGSSWVAKMLEKHPDILFSAQKSKKELRFFNTAGDHDYIKDNFNNFNKGINWYLNQFPDPAPSKIRGEFSISYLTDKEAPKNIKKYFSDIKIIAVLRNPTDMIYSLYWFSRATIETKVPDSFEELVDKHIFLDRGKYYKHLKRYFKLFPKENIHIILHDDLKKSPEKVLKKLYKFLNINSNYLPPDYSKRINTAKFTRFPIIQSVLSNLMNLLKKTKLIDNVQKYNFFEKIYVAYAKFNLKKADYPKMKIKTRKKLNCYYKKDIKKLEKLINVNLSDWR